MKKHFLTALCLTLAIGLSSCDMETATTNLSNSPSNSDTVSFKNGDLIPGQYIVVLKDKVRSVEGFIAQALPGKREEQSLYVYDEMNGFQGFAMKLSDADVLALNNNPDVAYVEQDRFVVLDNPHIGIDAGKPSGGGSSGPQTTPWGITRVNGGVNGVGLKACVIDTGVDLDHPDLTVDVANSRTFITTGKDANSADDGNGHGSHVSGTIGAKNNTIGVIGVAAGATIVGVKVLNSQGSGSNSSVIAGVNYVGTGSTGCTVANMSLGGSASQAIDDAVVAAAGTGIKFALAAGNESTSATTKSPARVNGPNIYTISAFANGGGFASFSNYGNPPVDFAEPGVSINSTWKGGGYNTISGTSMASPHAAGLLLLGNIQNGGTVSGDPDGNPDTIGVH